MIPDMRTNEETQEYREAVRHFAGLQLLAIETVLHEVGCFDTEVMAISALRERLDKREGRLMEGV
jgi:hypothetical protein